jgi:hypothetical protein
MTNYRITSINVCQIIAIRTSRKNMPAYKFMIDNTLGVNKCFSEYGIVQEVFGIDTITTVENSTRKIKLELFLFLLHVVKVLIHLCSYCFSEG